MEFVQRLHVPYLRFLELLVIICFQLNKWTKYVLILVSILIPEQISKS